MAGCRRRGFTLIELLVVIAVIAVLLLLFLPGVQKVREASNRTVCVNNLKQIGNAFQTHYQLLDRIPDGGEYWDSNAYPRSLIGGAPARCPQQNWGWAYQILPFIGQEQVWNHANSQVVRNTLISVYFCPTRRSPQRVFDSRYGDSCMLDYAGNGGIDPLTTPPDAGSYGNGRDGVLVRRPNGTLTRSVSIGLADIPDGLSTTLMVSEKRMDIGRIGQNQPDDDQGYAAGWDWDSIRWGQNSPTRDRAGEWTPDRFGASHPGAMNALFADGSVRRVEYGIQSNTNPANLGVWQRVCSRNDRQPVDLGD